MHTVIFWKKVRLLSATYSAENRVHTEMDTTENRIWWFVESFHQFIKDLV